MKPGARLLLAFVVGPLATFPMTTCVFALWWLWMEGVLGETAGGFEGLAASVYFGLFALVFAYSVMLVLGIPITLALWKKGLCRARVMALAGGLVGAFPFVPMTRSALQGSYEGALSNALLYLVAGILSGAVSAWLVWRISSGGTRSLPAPPTQQEREAPHAHGSL